MQKADPDRAMRINSREVRKDFAEGQNNAVTAIAPGGVIGKTLEDRSDVYFRPAKKIFGFTDNRGLNPATIFHEALHSISGMGDIRLAEFLGLTVAEGRSHSAAITQALKDNNCVE